MELPSFLFLKKEEKIISQLIKLSDNIFSQLLSDTINYGPLVTRKAKTCRHFWVIWFKFGRVVAKYWLCYAHWFKYRQSIMFMSCVSSSSFFSLYFAILIHRRKFSCKYMWHVLWNNILVYLPDKISCASQFSNYFTNLGGVCNYIQNTSQLCGYFVLLMKLEHFSMKMELEHNLVCCT